MRAGPLPSRRFRSRLPASARNLGAKRDGGAADGEQKE
jgi:hypothetical protein